MIEKVRDPICFLGICIIFFPGNCSRSLGNLAELPLGSFLDAAAGADLRASKIY